MRADGCCVSDIKTKFAAGLAINQISKAKSETMPWRKKQTRGYCICDTTTKCDAGLAINQISKAKSETRLLRL